MSTRTQFIAAFVTMLAAIVALAWIGFSRLEEVARGAQDMSLVLARLGSTARIEDTLRDLGAEQVAGDSRKLLAELDQDLAEFRDHGVEPRDAKRFAAFEAAVAEARANPTPANWFRAGEIVGEIEDTLIRRSQNADTRLDTRGTAARGAATLLYVGIGVIAIFGAASAIVFVRMRREQREAQDRLRRSDRLAALGTIAASVAHEINNPLATISGCAAAVRDRMKRLPNACPDSLEYLEMIQDETRRCTGIVKSLRDLARDGPPATAPADLPKIARSVVALLEMDRKAKAVVFSVEGADHLEAICDPDKLKQLLLNLLINARDASEPGGAIEVRVSHPADGQARIEVTDQGRGIEKRDLVRVFEPFHTDKTQGLGIGLFLCERIAAQHGGTIRAESEGRGKGARFVVEFPTRTSGQIPADTVS